MLWIPQLARLAGQLLVHIGVRLNVLPWLACPVFHMRRGVVELQQHGAQSGLQVCPGPVSWLKHAVPQSDASYLGLQDSARGVAEDAVPGSSGISCNF
jgi:hypothetical protein